MFLQLLRASLLTLILQLCVLQAAIAAGDHNGRGTKAVSLANAFVALADNPWAIAYNPAGLAQLKSFEIATFFVPQQFGLSELATVSASGVLPLGSFVAGFEVDQFGFELYKESTFRAGLGAGIDGRLNAGVTLNLSSISLGSYGTARSTTVDIGLQARTQEAVQIGFSARNVFGAHVGSTIERLPQLFLLGMQYTFQEDIMLVLEVEKDVRYPTMIKAGVEKSLFSLLTIRAGVSNNPDKFSAGLGIRYSGVQFGYAGYSHPQLGWTHQVELSFMVGGE